MNDKSAKPIDMMTLKQLCAELKVDPREARERLRLTVRDAKKHPELAKSHKPGHIWSQARTHMVVAEKLDRTEGGQYGPDCQLLTFTQLCPLWHLKRNL